MSDLLIEKYQIVLGTGPADAGATVMSPDFLTYASAAAHLKAYQDRVAAGEVELGSGLGFHIRPTPGNQTLTISDPVSRSSLASDLATRSGTMVLFARYRDPQAAVQTVRWGSVSFAKAREMDP